MNADNHSLSGINRAMAIICALEARSDLSLAELARSTELGEPTALRYASSLVAHGVLQRDLESGRYRLGLRLFELGERALSGRDPRAVALPYMRRLGERFEETVNLGMRQRDEIVLVEVLESTRSVRKGASRGDRDAWASSSLGKAILAHVSGDEARRLVTRRGANEPSVGAAKDIEELFGEFKSIRSRGFALDDLESEFDVRCVGAVIFDRNGTPSYAISVAGPSSRITRKTAMEIGPVVGAAAAAISTELGHLSADEPRPAPTRAGARSR